MYTPLSKPSTGSRRFGTDRNSANTGSNLSNWQTVRKRGTSTFEFRNTNPHENTNKDLKLHSKRGSGSAGMRIVVAHSTCPEVSLLTKARGKPSNVLKPMMMMSPSWMSSGIAIPPDFPGF